MAFFEAANISWIQTLARGLKRLVTFMLPVVGVVQFLVWLVKDWWSGLIAQFLERIDSVIDEISIAIGFGEVSIPWSKINSIIPLTECVSMMITFQAIVIALIIIKWVRNFTPFIN